MTLPPPPTRAQKLSTASAFLQSVERTIAALAPLVFPPGLAVALPDGRRGTVISHSLKSDRPRVQVRLPQTEAGGNGWVFTFPTVEELLAANPHLGAELAEDLG